jgi:hypothetical protein
LPGIAQAFAKILGEARVELKYGVCHIQALAGCASMLRIDEIGNDARKHDFAEPFVARAAAAWT